MEAFLSRCVAEREQMEGIITGVGKRSMGSWRKIQRRGHEAQEKDEECKKGSPPAGGVERRGIVNRRDAKEAHAEK